MIARRECQAPQGQPRRGAGPCGAGTRVGGRKAPQAQSASPAIRGVGARGTTRPSQARNEPTRKAAKRRRLTPEEARDKRSERSSACGNLRHNAKKIKGCGFPERRSLPPTESKAKEAAAARTRGKSGEATGRGRADATYRGRERSDPSPQMPREIFCRQFAKQRRQTYFLRPVLRSGAAAPKAKLRRGAGLGWLGVWGARSSSPSEAKRGRREKR